MPAAPPTFSITNCCPSTSDIPTARMRAAVSVELPAANGTTTVTGRVGQLCAEAAPTVTRVASAESMTRGGLNMILFLQSVLFIALACFFLLADSSLHSEGCATRRTAIWAETGNV